MKFHLRSEELIGDEALELKLKFPDINVYFLDDKASSCESPCLFVEENLEPPQVVSAVNRHNLRHLVQKNKGYFAASLASAGRLMQKEKEYFEKEYCFSEETVIEALTIEFAKREDKMRLKEEALRFIESLKSGAVTTAAEAIIEELYMNAVIDAPREAADQGLKITSITNELFLCRTENWLQISCTDPYGSLSVAKFIERMDEVYSKGAGDVINMEESEGAGLGCVILFENSACMILGVQQGQKTKVSCLIPLGISNRRRAEMRKSLHWLEV